MAIFETLMTEPLLVLAWVAAVLISISVHEFAHAYVATRLGDDTPENDGRLTLNPLVHIDVLGLMALLLIGFGWGKPVSINPDRLSDKRYGPLWTSLAGPAANILFAVLASAVLQTLPASFGNGNLLVVFLWSFININIILLVFNLIPLPPLDGSKIILTLIPERFQTIKAAYEIYGAKILFFLVIIDILLPVSLIGAVMQPIFSWIIELISFKI